MGDEGGAFLLGQLPDRQCYAAAEEESRRYEISKHAISREKEGDVHVRKESWRGLVQRHPTALRAACCLASLLGSMVVLPVAVLSGRAPLTPGVLPESCLGPA